jgi:hypothetical protein
MVSENNELFEDWHFKMGQNSLKNCKKFEIKKYYPENLYVCGL